MSEGTFGGTTFFSEGWLQGRKCKSFFCVLCIFFGFWNTCIFLFFFLLFIYLYFIYFFLFWHDSNFFDFSEFCLEWFRLKWIRILEPKFSLRRKVLSCFGIFGILADKLIIFGITASKVIFFWHPEMQKIEFAFFFLRFFLHFCAFFVLPFSRVHVAPDSCNKARHGIIQCHSDHRAGGLQGHFEATHRSHLPLNVKSRSCFVTDGHNCSTWLGSGDMGGHHLDWKASPSLLSFRNFLFLWTYKYLLHHSVKVNGHPCLPT